MKTLTIILAIMLSSISFGAHSTDTTTNWHNQGNYKEVVRAIFQTLSTSKECDDLIRPILSIISKVYQKMKRGKKHNSTIDDSFKRNLAKAVAKAILINSTPENEQYGFDENDKQHIETIRNHFIMHIFKHFSQEDGKFAQNGIHSRLIYKTSTDDKNIIIQNISKTLEKIIDTGKIVFKVNNGIMKIELEQKSGISVPQIAGQVGQFSVEKLLGRPGDSFKTVKEQQVQQVQEIDGIYFFFQLHLAPTTALKVSDFNGEQTKDSPPDGRYGSCFVDLAAA